MIYWTTLLIKNRWRLNLRHWSANLLSSWKWIVSSRTLRLCWLHLINLLMISPNYWIVINLYRYLFYLINFSIRWWTLYLDVTDSCWTILGCKNIFHFFLELRNLDIIKLLFPLLLSHRTSFFTDSSLDFWRDWDVR